MNRGGVFAVLLSLVIPVAYTPVVFADDSQLNFKIYSPEASSAPASTPTESSTEPTMAEPATTTQTPAAAAPVAEPAAAAAAAPAETTPAAATPAAATATTAEPSTPQAAAADDAPVLKPEQPTAQTPMPEPTAEAKADAPAADATTADAPKDGAATEKVASGDKVLQGFIRVVPKDTKVPIIMDTAVDSDTSQEGDEFAARTSEDMTIDGQCVVPAGSVIKGRIAQLNAPKRFNRTGSVALKFDTITTPDNKQIPLVANLVARGGVVHARRGLKDIAIDTGIWVAPTGLGLAIGALAGNSSKSLGAGGGAMIGVAVGAAVGTAILCAKKGKKIDVRPGDELKINLAEDLRMPMM